MKNLKTFKARRILIFVLCFVVIIITALVVLSDLFKINKNELEYVTLSQAPQSALNREYGGTNYIKPGISYSVNDSGEIVISRDGIDYIVRSDGTVWMEDENGHYVQVKDSQTISTVLTDVLSATEQDENIKSLVNDEAITNNIDLTSLSDESLKELADALGVSQTDLLNLAHEAQENNTSLTLSDVLPTLDLTDMTDDELEELAKILGVNPDILKDIVHKAQDNGKAISLNEALSEVLKNDDIILLDSYLKAASGGDENFYEDLGLEKDLDAEKVLEQLKNSFNPDTGEPYTPEEFMNIAMQEGIVTALEKIGFEVVDNKNKNNDNQLLTFNANSSNNKTGVNGNTINGSNSSVGYVPGSFLGDSSSLDLSTYDASQDLTYLANAISEASITESKSSSFIIQNGQSAKKSFLTSLQTGTSIESVKENSLNMITAGTIINGTLITGINSDLPGQIIAVVSQNVYDSFNQTNLLIPKGSRLVATYDSSITWGQDRILIAWNQLIRPDGLIIRLNGYQGVDSRGFSGQTGNVDNHIWSIVGATGAASMIEYFTSSTVEKVTNSLLKALVSSTQNSVNDITNQLLEKVINRQPTITIDGGTKISILVNDNVVIPTYKE